MKTKYKSFVAALTLASAAILCAPSGGASTVPEVPADSVAYAQAQTDSASRAIAAVMGPLINRNLLTIQGLGVNIDRKIFARAIATYLDGGNIGFNETTGDAYISNRVRALHPVAVDTVSMASQQQYLAQAAAQEGAITLPGGTVFIVLQEGEGGMPVDGDKVTLTYVGKLSDGTVFDTTEEDGPIEFDVNGVVPGFSEGLKHMRPGGTYRIVIPASQAYGAEGVPNVIPGNSALDFTIQLLGVTNPTKD